MNKETYLKARDLVQEIESTQRKITTITQIKKEGKNEGFTIESNEGDIINTTFGNVKKALKKEKRTLKSNLKSLEKKLAAL